MKSIDERIAKKRLISFQRKSEEIINNYRQELLDKKVEVLFENSIKKEKKYFGRDKYANAVIVKSGQDLTGKIMDVKIKNFNHNTLFGEISL